MAKLSKKHGLTQDLLDLCDPEEYIWIMNHLDELRYFFPRDQHKWRTYKGKMSFKTYCFQELRSAKLNFDFFMA